MQPLTATIGDLIKHGQAHGHARNRHLFKTRHWTYSTVLFYIQKGSTPMILFLFFVSLSHPYSMFTLMIANEHIQCNTYLVQSIIYKNRHTKNVLLLTVVYGFTVVPRWLPCPFSIVSIDFIVNDINFRLSLS